MEADIHVSWACPPNLCEPVAPDCSHKNPSVTNSKQDWNHQAETLTEDTNFPPEFAFVFIFC